MSQPYSCAPTKFFTLEGNQVFLLHEDFPNSEIIHVSVDFKWFGEV